MPTPDRKFFSAGRIEAFSDGVFAIIVTLLVLEIRVPHIEHGTSVAELAMSLGLLAPKFVSWIISFFTVCVIWINHHRLFKLFRDFDAGLFWWNVVLLLWVAFIPFPTALIGDYPLNRLAASLYGIVLGLMGLSFFGMRLHAIRNDRLLQEFVVRSAFRKGTLFTLLFGALLYFAGSGLAWLHPLAAFACYTAIPLYYMLPHEKKEI